MRELPWRRLARWLPADVREEVFEPALSDLRIAWLSEAEPGSGLRRLVRDARYALRVLHLFADCWRVRLLRRPARPDAATSHSRNRSERVLMFLYYLHHAIRRLLREPAFTVAATLTLALGVGANVAVFAVVEAVLLRPLPYDEADGLVILHHRDLRTGITKEFIAIGDYVDLAERQSAVEQLVSYGSGRTTMYDEAEPFAVASLGVSEGFFDALRVRPAAGRGFTAEDHRPDARVMMLGYDLWQNRFAGDPGIVGRSIRIGQQTRTVTGIAPRGFRFPPNSATEVILPISVPASAPAARKSDWTFALARLAPGQTVERATADMASISRQLEREYPESNQASTYYFLPLRDALVGSTGSALVLMLAAVAVVLLIACANVANLQLARSLARRREMAVRMALGAGRGRLATLLLAESLVLAGFASGLGILFAQWGVRALVALVPASVDVPGLADVRINVPVLAFALAIAVATALAFGLVASMTMRLEQAADVLVTAGRASMGRLARRATSGLVIVEVALAVVLLMGAGLILRSFAGLLAVDPGFRIERVMTMGIQLPADRYADANARSAFYTRAFDALRAVPGVEEAGAGVVIPLTGNNWTVPFERPEQPVPAGERPPDVGWQAASGGFFRTLEIPLIDGRFFGEQDRPGGNPVVIISEAIQQRFFPNESAVGRRVKLGQNTAEIVGVVGSIRRAGLNDQPRADMYFPFEMNPGGQIVLFVRTAGEPVPMVNSLRAPLRGIEPNTLFQETSSLSDIASESIRVTELLLWLLGVFSVTALLLAAVGIYGVMACAVRQRTREIGTRMAVGATRNDILLLVMRQGSRVAALGLAAGLALGLLAARSLRSVLYGVSATDPTTLTVAAAVLGAATLLACYLPARRASATDPARTLSQP